MYVLTSFCSFPSFLDLFVESLQSELALALLYDDVPLFQLDITVLTTLNVRAGIALAGDPCLHLIPGLVYQTLEFTNNLIQPIVLFREDATQYGPTLFADSIHVLQNKALVQGALDEVAAQDARNSHEQCVADVKRLRQS